jgi:hypothetical protein
MGTNYIHLLCSVYNIILASKMFHSFSFHTCYSSAYTINAPCVYYCLQPTTEPCCIRCSSISNNNIRLQAAIFTPPRAAESSKFYPVKPADNISLHCITTVCYIASQISKHPYLKHKIRQTDRRTAFTIICNV